ncbi:MAG: 2-amino-4-hydroxy-6-hydroxymethyldihydropteridine diphosphokinase [Phycisphaerales bacterium]|nr:2-amino-4-hydroxy-6-hydroxymethyldihydropteridine diphosphokinase [Phycisphaerales bacterium]MCB9836670.1 2-amino-4-hydroxy-6-hydroxymethyldihydropteridine diphosphokinase [Phycisphaera sp.]
MTEAYIALGSNLGDRRQTLDNAVRAIDALRSILVIARSSLIETDPVGPIEQGKYLNGVIRIETDLTARELLSELLRIEASLGRDRSSAERWGPRTVDLDLLIFGDAQIDEPGLRVPHPRIAERRFVLEPLYEISPNLIVPGIDRSVRELLAEMKGEENPACS